ncbi:unnamed protein product [Sphagnum troendelagicum]
MAILVYMFYMSKYVEFMDTVVDTMLSIVDKVDSVFGHKSNLSVYMSTGDAK